MPGSVWGSHTTTPPLIPQTVYTYPAPLTKSVVGFVPPSPPRQEGVTKTARKGVQITKSAETREPPSGAFSEPLPGGYPTPSSSPLKTLHPPICIGTKQEAPHVVFWGSARLPYKH